MSKPFLYTNAEQAQEALKNWWNRKNFHFSLREGILFIISVTSLVLSVAVDIFWLRIITLFIGMGSAVAMYLLMPVIHRDETGETETNSQNYSQPEDSHVKKIIFDDLHSDYGKQIETENEEPFEETIRIVEKEIEKQTIEQMPEPMDEPLPLVQEQHALEGFPFMKKEVKPPREFQVNDFFDVNSELFRDETEPRAEFNYLLNKVLAAVKETLFANTVAFFWSNQDKQQMVLETRITESSCFMNTRRFSIGNDLVSNVAVHGKPELLTSVNPVSELELFMYYNSASGVKSFAGVPVFYTNSTTEPTPEIPVAVLTVDSIVEDAFGEETIEQLGRFTKLISSLIKSYTSKYELLVDSEVLSSLKKMQSRLRGDFSVFNAVQSLAEETSKLVSWDFLTIVLFDETKNAWTAKKVMNRAYEPYIAPEQVIEFPNSIAGRTIKNNQFTIVEGLDKSPLPRFYKEEKVTTEGSFLSVPISSLNKCYGSLNIESREPANYTRQDVTNLIRLTENVATTLEVLYLNEIIREHVIIDEVTGMYSNKFFLQRISEELQRAEDTDVELAMLMMSVDHAQEISQRYGDGGFERVITVLSKTIRSSIRPYDVVGRIDENKFGVLLISTSANDAQIWAEKIRKNVSSLTIALEDKSFSVTLSIGVCGVVSGMRREELFASTVTVLHRATETGGNAVRIF
ncbi:MAG: diguanylate cyclase [Ignavibacteriales bacterium]|nr:diguanylate cyclase [Ignavibacteriales bacterium]